jgi:hypothetical protein
MTCARCHDTRWTLDEFYLCEVFIGFLLSARLSATERIRQARTPAIIGGPWGAEGTTALVEWDG